LSSAHNRVERLRSTRLWALDNLVVPTEHGHENLHRRPIGLVRKQAQHKNKIEHQSSRQRACSLFPAPVLANDTIDQFNRKRARQHTDRGLAGQATDRALAQSQDP